MQAGAGMKQSEMLDSYIRSASLSPDFSTSYDEVLAFAKQRPARADYAQTRSLLMRLVQARPERTEAQTLLQRLPK